MPEKIRVLVIDDSAMVRKVITDTLHQDPDIEVVGTAQDPLFAIEKIPKLRPDVLTLDMEMPRMDGLTFLRKLKAEKSTIPVVVVSALTQQGSQMALDAMEAGACDILAKPDGSYSIGALAGRLAFHVKAAARSRRQPQLTPVKTAPASGSVRPVAIASGGQLPLDPWQEPYAYRYPGVKNKDSYDLFSKGPDKTEGTADDVGNW